MVFHVRRLAEGLLPKQFATLLEKRPSTDQNPGVIQCLQRTTTGRIYEYVVDLTRVQSLQGNESALSVVQMRLVLPGDEDWYVNRRRPLRN
jgi:hypothetical protein